MADWGPCVGDAQWAIGYGNLTPDATAHTKSAWASINSNTDRSDGLLIAVPYLQHHTSIRTLLVDIGFGSPEQTIISNLMLCPPTGGLNTCRAIAQTIWFPVSLPPIDLKVRSQASIASHGTFSLRANKIRSGLPMAGTVVDTYGADTANTRGVVATGSTTEGVFGSWAEVTASSNRVKALMIAVGNGNQSWAAYSNQWYYIDIGIGGAGSEQVVLELREAGGSSSGTGTAAPLMLGPFFVDIPDGSRISVRTAKQYSSSSQRTLDVVLYGIR